MNSNGLKISIVINILLAGLVVWLVHRKPENPPSAVPAIIDAELQTQAPVSFSSPEPVSAAQAFRWSQLESSDYRTYIANLRGIGCPEQTIRDIITADVDEAFYAPRRDQLKQAGDAQAVDSALQQLNSQESAFIASLLGTETPSAQVVASNPRPPRFVRKSQAELDLSRPASVPLALQLADSPAMNLTAVQAQTVNDIRQTFLDQIGGTNQDPNDPAYRQRWQAAQREADTMLVGMLGQRFVLNYQMQRQNQAAAASK